MRIRYTKPGGREVELSDAAARRLIAAGQAEAVGGEEAAVETESRPAESGRRPAPAKKTTRRSK